MADRNCPTCQVGVIGLAVRVGFLRQCARRVLPDFNVVALRQ
jgi:hypothetical protein